MKKIKLIVAGLAVIVAGCGKPIQSERSSQACFETFRRDQVFNASLETLRQMHFPVEKADSEAGYLLSGPIRGGQWFEFWRQDIADSAAQAESDLHSVRRFVEIELAAQSNQNCVDCRVTIQRLSMPSEPIGSMHDVPGMFTKSDVGDQSLRIEEDQLEEMDWITLGTDPVLQEKILEQIQEQLRAIQ